MRNTVSSNRNVQAACEICFYLCFINTLIYACVYILLAPSSNGQTAYIYANTIKYLMSNVQVFNLPIFLCIIYFLNIFLYIIF